MDSVQEVVLDVEIHIVVLEKEHQYRQKKWLEEHSTVLSGNKHPLSVLTNILYIILEDTPLCFYSVINIK